MPLSIALVSQTGNVMKTTIAAALGLTLAAAGLDVLAVDLDPEHRALGASLATWLNERRERNPQRTQLDVATPSTAKEGVKLITESDVDVVLIDCPSRATEATFLIAANADFTILPLGPGDKDATLTINTFNQMMLAGIDPSRLAIILTRTGSDAEANDYRNWLQSAGLGGAHVIADHVRERVAYRNALTRRLAITEAQPVSVRVQARRAIDALITAFEAVTAPDSNHQRQGLAS